ncbi:MAG: HIT family protein [Candidatus Lokiarchaeota archaeon]|nr:HIT family protein [Candidatus Lokiarchaeota archaeon]
MKDKTCIFCQIVEKKIPSYIFFESDTNLAFLDIFPVSKGHTIVIPKNHYKNLEDIPDDELSKLFKTVKQISNKIYRKLKIQGYNILQNNFQAAGQVINHFHVHIIPRSRNDGKLQLVIPEDQSKEEELKNTLNLLVE